MDIFISSVGRDLKGERQAAISEVLKLGDRPIGMEYFGASPEPPLEACLSQLADADLVILVLGPSYGSVHSGTGVSYTENEFITPSTKLMTLFSWRRIGRGVRENSSSPPWA